MYKTKEPEIFWVLKNIHLTEIYNLSLKLPSEVALVYSGNEFIFR